MATEVSLNSRERCIRSNEIIKVVSPREIVASHVLESKLCKKFKPPTAGTHGMAPPTSVAGMPPTQNVPGAGNQMSVNSANLPGMPHMPPLAQQQQSNPVQNTSMMPPMPGQPQQSQGFPRRTDMPGQQQQPGTPPPTMTGMPTMPGQQRPGIPPMPGQQQPGMPPMPGQQQSNMPPMPGQQQSYMPPMPGQQQSNIPPMPGMQQPGMPPMPGYPPQPGQQPLMAGYPPQPRQPPMQARYPGQQPAPGYNQTTGGGMYQQPQQYQQQPRRLDIQVMIENQRNTGGAFVTNQAGVLPPLVTTMYVVQDQGNSSARFLRSSLYCVPATADILKTTALPFSLIVSPFARIADGEYEPPIVNFGALGPIRCNRCKAYMSPNMQFVDAGRRFQCLMCKVSTEVPSEYFQHYDHNVYISIYHR